MTRAEVVRELDAAGYDLAAKMVERAKSDRPGELEACLNHVEGMLVVAERNKLGEAESLRRAYDGIEEELDDLERRWAAGLADRECEIEEASAS